MFNWLTDLIRFGLNTVDQLGADVRNMAATLWSALVSFFTEQMQAAGYVAGQGGNLAGASVDFVIALFRLGIFILTIALPRLASNVISELSAWAMRQINALRNDLTAFINDVRNEAHSLLDDLRAALNAVETDFKKAISDIMGVLNWVRSKAEQFLTDPEVLARWLLASLWKVGKQFVEDNAVGIGRWFLGIAVNATIASAHILEDVIVALF